MTIDEVKKKLLLVHGKTVLIVEGTYTGLSKNATFIDTEHGNWRARVSRVISGSGHRRRREVKDIISIDKINTLLKVVHLDTVFIREKTYNGITKKAEFVDNIYGSWTAIVRDVLNGSTHPARGKENRKRTNIQKYGCENAFSNKEIKKKIIQTNLERHGVMYPQQSNVIRNKTRKANLKKYGYEYILQIPFIRDQIVKTNMKKYGVRCTSQDPIIRLKQARSSNKSFVLKHWFSNNEIVCQGSYEMKTVKYFNDNKIDYNWQVQTFLMLDDRTYTPDCYLPDENIWIEIKGYFRNDAKKKWDWFHKEHPNSELWDKQKLKEMGIL